MDTKTLAGALILVLFTLAGLGTLVAAYRRDSALTVWAVGMAGSAVGFTILLLPGQVPQIFPLLVGNGLVLSFQVSLPLGLRFFLKKVHPWPWRFTVYTLVWAASTTAYIVIWPQYQVRAAIISAFMVLMTVEFLVLVTVRQNSIPPLPRMALTTVGLLFVVFFSLRGALALSSPAPTLFGDLGLTTVTLAGTIVFSILWAGMLLLLDAGRLQAAVTANSEELRRLNRLKDRVLAMTSHDLRGPLGNLQVLWSELSMRMEKGQCTDDDRELFKIVDRSLAGTQSLLENLFSFAESQQPPGGQVPSTDLVTAARVVLGQWGPPATTKGILLRVEGEGTALVRAAFLSVVTVLRNLVGNAVKFTPAGGRVVVRVDPLESGAARVEVSDTGVGMGDELLKKTFRLESRASRPGTDGERGSGFGLVLVKELVAGWGGALSSGRRPAMEHRFWLVSPRGKPEAKRANQSGLNPRA